MKEFAAVEWERAKRALESASQLAHTDPDSAASRAYYAAFHALTAVFALRGNTFTRHAAIRAALHRDLIQAADLPAECGRDYDFLLALRDTGDYGGVTQVCTESAELAIGKAKKFLKALQPLYEKAL